MFFKFGIYYSLTYIHNKNSLPSLENRNDNSLDHDVPAMITNFLRLPLSSWNQAYTIKNILKLNIIALKSIVNNDQVYLLRPRNRFIAKARESGQGSELFLQSFFDCQINVIKMLFAMILKSDPFNNLSIHSCIEP